MNNKVQKIKNYNRFFDLVVVICSWALAYYLRFILSFGGDVPEGAIEKQYAGFAVILAAVSAITFKNLKLYSENEFNTALKDLLILIKANSFSFLIFLMIAFFVSEFRLSRIFLGIYLLSSTLCLCLLKLYIRKKISKTAVNIALIGDGVSLTKYYESISRFSHFVIKNWIDAPEKYKDLQKSDELKVSDLEKDNIDLVVIGHKNENASKGYAYLQKLATEIFSLKYLPDFDYAKIGLSYQDFQGIPMLSINEPKFSTFGLFAKRFFDLISCSLGMLIISPLLLIIGILVKLTSKGPIFYGQIRMGVDGKEFKMWKFRTMVSGDKNHEGWTVKDDPRVTSVGKFLRKTSLDELPQLWNVIMGDMSLVGPRPERPVFVDKFRADIPNYMLRHKFKAGITGWAQINGWRGDTSIEKRIECDLWYIKNWSFTLDISILFLTFWKGFINKNAY